MQLQRAALDKKILSQLGNDVGNHTIIRSRRRAEDGNVGRQDLDDPLNPTVVGSEVVTPVADAVCFVYDEESHRPSQSRQDLGAEVEVVQTFREYTDLAASDQTMTQEGALEVPGDRDIDGQVAS